MSLNSIETSAAERIAIYPALWMKPDRSFVELFRFVGL
jgi:hypothetical protein